MEAVLLAGGLRTRISEETSLKPKLMVEIGGRPITQRTRGQGDGEINTHV
jgi:NDP-sugar pyrophosphorylase family protein